MLKILNINYKKHQQNYQLEKMSKDLYETHNYPLNRSISKQLYSFPKANRFQSSRQPLCNKAFYDIKKGAMNNRTTTFGYGNKLDLVNREHVPPVGNYQLSGQFIYNRQKNKGYSFSKDNKSQTLNPQRGIIFPGPGTYSHQRQRSAEKYATLSYSMGGKLDDPMSRHQNPLGPGQYEALSSLTSSGNYFYSKYSNSGCGKIGRAQRKSINDPNNTPGPGKYQSEQKVSFNKTGVYFFSKFRNMQASKFSKSNRPSLADTKPVPGPGSYGEFSQFANINKSWMRTSTAGR